jgi:hypothetical protein
MSDTLIILVNDWDRLSGDDFLGMCRIFTVFKFKKGEVKMYLNTLTPEKTKEEWIPLRGHSDKDGVTGDIHILTHLTNSCN